MFKDKISHAKLKKDEATINMVLIITTRNQNQDWCYWGKGASKNQNHRRLGKI